MLKWNMDSTGSRKWEETSNRQSAATFPKLELPTNALNITFTAKQRWIEPFRSRQACAGSIKDGAFLNIICPRLLPQGHRCFCASSVECLCSSFWGRKNSTTPVSFYSHSPAINMISNAVPHDQHGTLKMWQNTKMKPKVRTQNKAKSMESVLRSQVLLEMGPTPECGW